MKPLNISEHTFFDSLLTPESTVVDLGANKCAFSRYFLENHQCRVIAVEPNPKLVNEWKNHPRLTSLNVAIGPGKGKVPFYVAKNSESSSFQELKPAELRETILVDTLTLAEIIDVAEIQTVDLLKIDIEGSEIDLLNNTPPKILQSIDQITVEFHDFRGLTPKTRVMSTIQNVRDLGFISVNMWMRSHGDVLFVNRNVKSIRKVDVMYAMWVLKPLRWLARKYARVNQRANDIEAI